MTTLDRYVLRALAVNYVIALAVMMSLYIMLDLFFNMDEFTESGGSMLGVLGAVVGYYLPNLFRYFGQLSGAITLFACMATLARMRKANELTALLASGVSLYRVAVPIIGFGILTTTLWVVDTEMAIPRVASKLARRHQDVRGQVYGVWFLEDRDRALLSAQRFHPETGTLERLMVLKRDQHGTVQAVIEADEAHWEEITGHPVGGRWALTRGTERQRRGDPANRFGPTDQMDRATVFYYESDLTPAAIQQRQSAGWISFLSSSQLAGLAAKGLPSVLAVAVQQARHQRFAMPIINLLLLLLGIPFLLDRDPGSILTDAGKCLALCGTCFAATFASQSVMGGDSYSALPTWLPIILFTPIAVILIDRIRT